MKNKKLFLFTFLLLIAAIFAGSSFRDFKIEKVKADTNLPGCSDSLIGRLSGYIWSDNIGWISLGENEGTYGVGIKSNKNLCGYGWADNIGWVSFNALDLNNCPNGECVAKIDGMTDKKISGWARACAGSTDGMCGEYTGPGTITSTTTITTLVDEPAGDTWVQKTTVNRNWYGVAISDDGKYQTAVVNGGQIFLSSDFGESWVATSTVDTWRKVGMSSTGQYQTVATQTRIFTSSDYGQSWKQATVNNRTGNFGSDLVVSASGQYQATYSSPVTGFPSAPGKIYTSEDYGNNWNYVQSYSTITGLGMSPEGNILTTTDADRKVYGSNNYGRTGSWVLINTGDNPNSRIFSSIAISSNGVTQIGVEFEGDVYVSTSSGDIWRASGIDQYEYWSDVAVSDNGQIITAVPWSDVNFANCPAYDGICYGKIHVSKDNGSTWKAVGESRAWTGVAMSADGSVQTAVVQNGTIYTSISPNKRIETTETTEIITTTNTAINPATFGKTWVENNIPPARLWSSVAVSSDGTYQTMTVYNDTTPNRTWNNNFDLGRIWSSLDGGASWNEKTVGDYKWIDLTMSSNGQYQSAVGGGSGGSVIATSTNYGATWSVTTAPYSFGSIDMSSTGQYRLATVYGGQIYNSSNYGNTWVAQTNTLTRKNWNYASMSADGMYQTAVVDDGYIYRSVDRGVSWSQVTTPTTAKKWYDVDVSSDGRYQTAVISSLSSGGIYYSDNYGASWQISDAPANNWGSIDMSADGKYQVVSGMNSSVDVYVSSNYGQTWESSGLSASLIILGDIAITSTGEKIFQVGHATTPSEHLYISSSPIITTVTETPVVTRTSILVDTGGTPVTTTVAETVPDPFSLRGSLNGGWDGWISLSGTTTDREKYGISGLTGDALTGFAWGSDILGWLDFYDAQIDFATCASGEVKDDNGICCPNEKLVTTTSVGLLGQTINNSYCQVCTGEKVEVDGQCLCPDGREDVAGQCVPVCTDGMVYFNDQCVEDIVCNQAGKVIYEGTCIDLCPNGSIPVGGVCECPAGEKMEFGICVPDCESLGKVKSIDGVCVDVCREGEVLFEGDCRIVCPEGTVDFNGQCIATTCPLGMVESNGECKDVCTDGQADQDGVCTDVCSDGFVKLAEVCVPDCPPPYEDVAGDCVIVCDDGLIEKNGKCVSDCGEGYKDNGEGQCVLDCLQGYKDFGNECVLDCAEGYVESDGICVKNCEEGYKADGGQCVLDCDEGMVQSDATTPPECISVTDCVSQGKVESYGECEDICSDWQVNIDGICQDSCDGGEVDDNGICKKTCTPPEVEYNQQCVAGCLEGYESIDGDCKKTCQENEYNFMDECLINCPDGYNKNEADGICELYCPDDDQGNKYKGVEGQCVMDCGDQIESDGVCQDQCDEGDVAIDGRCVKDCPEGQVESSNGEDCVDNCSLIDGEVENSGQCVGDCPEGRAELLADCVQGCPAGQTENADGKCVTDETIQYCGGVRPYGYVRSGAASINKTLVTSNTKLVWSFMPVKTRSKDLKVCEWTCKSPNSKYIYSRGGNRCFKNTIILD
jgi:hypothetical protein